MLAARLHIFQTLFQYPVIVVYNDHKIKTRACKHHCLQVVRALILANRSGQPKWKQSKGCSLGAN
jgi:hypothetical protein